MVLCSKFEDMSNAKTTDYLVIVCLLQLSESLTDVCKTLVRSDDLKPKLPPLQRFAAINGKRWSHGTWHMIFVLVLVLVFYRVFFNLTRLVSLLSKTWSDRNVVWMFGRKKTGIKQANN